MLSDSIVEEAQRLLAEGRLNRREIAAELEISRGTVQAIAAGRRRPRPPKEEPDPGAMGPPIKCSGCGFRVYMPCRICAARTAAVVQALRWYGRHGTPLKLELKPEHQARYEEVRHARAALENPHALRRDVQESGLP